MFPVTEGPITERLLYTTVNDAAPCCGVIKKGLNPVLFFQLHQLLAGKQERNHKLGRRILRLVRYAAGTSKNPTKFWEYSYHLNTKHLNTTFIWILDSMGVRYSNGKVTWLGGRFEYQTFWTINRLFQSGFQTTIWISDHLATGQKSTIWIPD